MLNRTSTVILQEWLWHQITYEDWYAINNEEERKKEGIFKKFLLYVIYNKTYVEKIDL